MKSLNKLINILLLAVLMIMVLILTVFSFGLTGSELLQNIEADLYQNPAAGLIFLAILLLTAWALYPLFQTKSKVATISSDEHGSINITLEALDKMIRGIVREEKGLEIKSTELNSRETGMEVQMRIAVEENQNIPDLTERIKNDVRYRLKDITGAEIEKVQILIESISPGKRKPDFSHKTPGVKPAREKESRKELDEKKEKLDREIDKEESDNKVEAEQEIEKEEKKSSMDKILDKFRKKEAKREDHAEDEDSLKTKDKVKTENQSGAEEKIDIDKWIKEEDEEDKEKAQKSKNQDDKKGKTDIEDVKEDREEKQDNSGDVKESGQNFAANRFSRSTKEDKETERKSRKKEDSEDSDKDSPGGF